MIMAAYAKGGLNVSDSRSKAALFRNNIGTVKRWILDGYGLEAIAAKLKDEFQVELSTETLRTYIRREFNCGPRELREKLSHEKNELTPKRPSNVGADVSPSDVGPGVGKVDIEGQQEEAGLNSLLNANERQNAVSLYFGKKHNK